MKQLCGYKKHLSFSFVSAIIRFIFAILYFDAILKFLKRVCLKDKISQVRHMFSRKFSLFLKNRMIICC